MQGFSELHWRYVAFSLDVQKTEAIYQVKVLPQSELDFQSLEVFLQLNHVLEGFKKYLLLFRDSLTTLRPP